MNKKGIALILSFMVIVVLTILSTAVISYSVSERAVTQRYMESTRAFWLSEAGINRALNELRTNYDTLGNGLWVTTMGAGRYQVDVAASGAGGQDRLVTSRGCVPDVICGNGRAERIVEATMAKFPQAPVNFFDNAIYTPGNVNISGSAYTVTGEVRYGGTITPDPPVNILPADNIHDPSVTTLARFDYNQLRAISQAQNNYHDTTHNPDFPTSFWYDQTEGIPNVVFVDGDFDISGKKQTVGGFVIVGGDVLYDASITGNAAVNGIIYTLGTCEVKGGGGVPFNVNGGIWAGQGVTITGSTVINYNITYMSSIQNLNLIFTVQINSWRDTQNPYN